MSYDCNFSLKKSQFILQMRKFRCTKTLFSFATATGLDENYLSDMFSYLLAPTKKQEKKGGKADAGKDIQAHVW